MEEGGAVVIKNYDITNISWDMEVDGIEQTDIVLPRSTSIIVKQDEDEDAETIICEYLSNKYGFCINSFEYELVPDLKGYIIHFHQTIDGVDDRTPRYWRSNACNYEHAVEQLKDHIERELGEKVTFVELIGTNK